MKILHVITTLNIGGAEMMLFKLLSRIDSHRFENRVICLMPPGPVGRRIEETGIPVRYMGLTTRKVSFKAISKALSFAKAFRPDLIQTWLYHADAVGLIVSKLCRPAKTIWNIRCSEMNLSHYRPTTAGCIKMCSKLSHLPSAVVTNSHAARDYHIQIGYRPRRFEVIPNGFDLGLFRPEPGRRTAVRNELGIGENDFCITLVARMDPKKDHHTFFEAVRQIQLNNCFPHVVLCGHQITTDTLDIDRLRQILPDGDRVHLLGPRQDVHRIVAASDLCVSSSAYGEGFPNTVGEAMAGGVPCVVTDVGDSARIVGEAGKVVRPRNPEELARAMQDFMAMPADRRHTIGMQARERIRANYELDQIVRRYEELYQEIGLNRYAN